ncbi:MAG: sugar ABC transporter permease [Hyphomicrobiaceae bacterium]|nr:MAG: sugar ABC transporter permease [Hyphomicrobiaceae bacterium]
MMAAARHDGQPAARPRGGWAGRFAESAAAGPWLLPALAVLGLILVYPLVLVVGYSFTDRTSALPGDWVGIENYKFLFGESLFWSAVKNNLILLLSVPISVGLALVLTAIIYRGIWAGGLWESLLFLPFLPAVAAIGVVFLLLLGNDGPINSGLEAVGLGALVQPWLTDPTWAIWAILLVVIWKRVGFTVLLFMARMLSVDRELFDAAAVDGAPWWKTFRHVAVPELRSIILFAAVLGIIEVFAWSFAYVFVLTRGGPFQSSYTLEYLLYRFQFQEQLVGIASAVAVVLVVIALCVAAYRMRLLRQEGVL